MTKHSASECIPSVGLLPYPWCEVGSPATGKNCSITAEKFKLLHLCHVMEECDIRSAFFMLSWFISCLSCVCLLREI